MKRRWAETVALATLVFAVDAHCPNSCNGRGRCTAVSKCDCYGGWTGGDCSKRSCPTGVAWADVASGYDDAHGPAECSNRGHCNTISGQCTCMAGFEGLACNRMTCPEGCGAHGSCRSMKFHAALYDKGMQPRNFYYSYANNWDAEAIYGCSCDFGYGGYSCSERQCPTGDDPLTTNQVDEVQYIRCDYSSTATLAWTLSFKGAVTAPFSGATTAAQLKALLEALPTVGTVGVTYTGLTTTFCNNNNAGTVPSSDNAVAITFLTDHGAQPALVVLDEHGALLTGLDDNSIDVKTGGASVTRSTGAGTTALLASVIGTKESAPCSNRGTCDRATGLCSCYTGFGASNMLGAAGSNPDCGAVVAAVTSCPGTIGLIECSGRGTCVASSVPLGLTYTCQCNAGWGGGACSERACPLGEAWFDYPSAPDTAHALAECSGKGKCNRATGVCDCQTLFEGSACERMACPGKTAGGAACSGHGQCLSMSSLAALAKDNGESTPYTYGADPSNAATWDGGKVFGCGCDPGWGGYDCSQAQCAVGEDITAREWESQLTDETQAVTCTYLAGTPTFKLQFRDQQTAALAYGSTAAQVEAALEALSTVGDVTVTMVVSGTTTVATAACASPVGTTVIVAFLTEHGDIPPIRVVMSGQVVTGHWAAGAGWTDTQLQVRCRSTRLQDCVTRLEMPAGFQHAKPLPCLFSSCTAVDWRRPHHHARLQRQLRVHQGRAGLQPRGGAVLGGHQGYVSAESECNVLSKREATGSPPTHAPHRTKFTAPHPSHLAGTTSTAVCSGRGYCDAATGQCSCFRGFGSSDGARGKGLVSDCGFREPFWPPALRGAGE